MVLSVRTLGQIVREIDKLNCRRQNCTAAKLQRTLSELNILEQSLLIVQEQFLISKILLHNWFYK